MASTPVFVIAPPGLTLTLRLFPEGSDTIANGASGDSLTEETNRNGLYQATVTQAITGKHYCLIEDASNNAISIQWVLLADTTDNHYGVDDHDSDLKYISGSQSASDNLEASTKLIVQGTVDTATNSHTPTTTVFQADDITEATADHYIGRVVIFASGALLYQQATITDYEAVGGIAQFTVDAMTEAPANNDTFVII